MTRRVIRLQPHITIAMKFGGPVIKT
jgi:hypothetical protein